MLGKMQPNLKSGDEPLSYDGQPLPFSLLDFWRWSVSDIMSNATRGLLAEFIVATAVGIDRTAVRDEWSPYDLETSDGIKIEVKSCAYLQTWHQKSLSTINFSIRESRHWDSNTGTFADEVKRQADVYVFCLLHHQDKQTVDPLNLNQWEFYVVATKQLNESAKGRNSISLKSLMKLVYAIPYSKLKAEIETKSRHSTEGRANCNTL